MINKEMWRDTIRFKGWYQASSTGRVKRVRPGGPSTYVGRILKPFDYGGGYLAVTLFKNGKRKLIYVHVLVLEAFIGPRPSYNHVAHHKNENKKDNRVENLEWVTISRHHRVLHPWTPCGSKEAP